MPLPNVIALGGIIAMFASFVAVLGSVSIWQQLADRRDRARTATAAHSVAAQDNAPPFRKAA